MAFIRRGVAHYLGNEQASKVTGWKAKRAEEGNPANDAEVAAFQADCISAALKAAYDGTMGSSVRGPRGTALETVMRQIALGRVRVLLGNAGLSVPKKAEDSVAFANGDSFTLAQLVKRQIEAEPGSKSVTFFGNKTVQAEAEAKMKADERAKAKAAEAKGAGASTVADLGL